MLPPLLTGLFLNPKDLVKRNAAEGRLSLARLLSYDEERRTVAVDKDIIKINRQNIFLLCVFLEKM